MKNHIGIIGFGPMSQNLTLNLIKKNFFLSIFNKDKIFLNKRIFNIKIITNNLKKFVSSFLKNKIIILLIKTGLPIKIILIRLKKKLKINDIIIDFGNSYYKNTYLNKLLINKKFNFFSAGISGGINGALYGLCIMLDGNLKLIKNFFFFLKKITILKNKRYSFSLSLGFGSSHYLKMIHNGIEYGILQILSEIFFLLKIITKDKYKIINIIYFWNKTENKSFLLKILLNILIKKKKKISDIIDQKGTGMWSCLISIKKKIIFNSIIEAIIIRIISKNKILRKFFNNKNIIFIKGNISIFINNLKKFFLFCNVFCYIQGFNNIIKIKKKYKWFFYFNNIVKSYLNSCIINAKILFFFLNCKKNFFLINFFFFFLKKNFFNLNKIIKLILISEISCFSLISCYNFLKLLISNKYCFKIIQFQRNYFGNHKIKFL